MNFWSHPPVHPAYKGSPTNGVKDNHVFLKSHNVHKISNLVLSSWTNLTQRCVSYQSRWDRMKHPMIKACCAECLTLFSSILILSCYYLSGEQVVLTRMSTLCGLSINNFLAEFYPWVLMIDWVASIEI